MLTALQTEDKYCIVTTEDNHPPNVNCPIDVRLELIRAGFATYDSTPKEHIKRKLAEGIFWLCDGIKEELEASDHPRKGYCIGYLKSLTEVATDIFKTGLKPEELNRIDEYCLKVGTCSTDITPMA